MRSLIIHMSSAKAREGNVTQLLRDLPQAEIIEAVNGREAGQIAGVQSHPGTLHRPTYPFALSPAEIGVFQSHRRCWQRIVDEGWDMAMIVEDDLRVDTAQFQLVLAMVRDHATPEMYIRIPPKQRETPGHLIATQGDMALFRPRHVALQCCCQVVGRAAALRLLAASVKIDRPVDTWLQMHWVTGQPIHCILPNGNAEIAGQIGGSTIQQKTRTSGKLMREFKRAVYRAKLNAWPQG